MKPVTFNSKDEFLDWIAIYIAEDTERHGQAWKNLAKADATKYQQLVGLLATRPTAQLKMLKTLMQPSTRLGVNKLDVRARNETTVIDGADKITLIVR